MSKKEIFRISAVLQFDGAEMRAVSSPFKSHEEAEKSIPLFIQSFKESKPNTQVIEVSVIQGGESETEIQ